MTVAFRPTHSPQRKSPQKAATSPTASKVTPITQARLKNGVRPSPQSYGGGTKKIKSPEELSRVEVLPSSPPQPLWLKSLLGIQRTSSIVMAALAGTTLTIYGCTIYAQANWTEKYQQLEALRYQEQQLSITNEVLKHQIAQDAEQPNSGLVPLKSTDRIFIQSEPVSISPPPAFPKTAAPVPQHKSIPEKPVGY